MDSNGMELSLQEIQQSSLQIMKRVAQICEEQHLRYSLAYGTLLGAVRHKGFIPWDDDLDIMMPRPDYERLLAYLDDKREEIRPLEVLNMKTRRDYPHIITRISDSRYRLEVTNERDYGLGTFVDIYVVDGIGNTPEEGAEVIRRTMDYPSLIFLATRRYYHFGTTKGWGKRLKKVLAFAYTHLRGKAYFVKELNRRLDQLDYAHSQYVGIAAWGERPKDPARKVMRKEWLEETMLAPFEDTELRISRHYDEVLKLNYGNYMQLPPERDRIQHHLYKAYRKDSVIHFD